MRFVMRFIGVLAAALLFAVPVMGIGAQGGIVVPSPVIPETGTGGEIQALTESLLYHGSGYVPGMAASMTPKALPETGYDEAGALRDAYAQLRANGEGSPASLPKTGVDAGRPPFYEALPPLLAPSIGGVTVTSGQPQALRQVGSHPTPGASGATLDPNRDCRWCAVSTKPQAGTGSESLLPEEIVGVMAGQSAAPDRLPVTGSHPNPYLELLEQYRHMYGGLVSPVQLPQTGTGAESLLPEEIVGVMAGQSAVPNRLPVTGSQPNPYLELLEQYRRMYGGSSPAQLPVTGASSGQTSSSLPRIETHPDSGLSDVIDLMTSAIPGAPGPAR